MTTVDERNERGLIGCLLQGTDAQKQLARLTPYDVEDPLRMAILTEMLSEYEQRKPIDLQTVSVALPKLLGEMLACVRVAPSTVMAESFANAVLRRSAQRRLVGIATELAQSAQELNPEEAAQNAIDRLHGITTGQADAWVSLGQIVSETYDGLSELAAGKRDYLETGMPGLDKRLGGLFPGELTILGARPGVGKSALGASIAWNLSKRGKHVAVCSLEMSPKQYVNRLLSAQSGVDGRKLRLGKGLTDADWGALQEAANELSGLWMPFCFAVSTAEELRAQVEREKDAHGMDLLVVDYLQLLRTKKQTESRYVTISEVSWQLKRMALELNMPVMALAQVARPEQKGKPTMPTLDALRGSGDIEQDADCVILLHRAEDVADEAIEAEDRTAFSVLMAKGLHYLSVNIAKQRNGPIGKFGVAFDPAHMKFMEMAV